MLAALMTGEGDLLKRLQQRDPNALAELYDRYGRMTYGLILRIVQDAGTAEDLVQETFLRVWNRAAGLDSERGAVGPWLLAVARNRAIDYLRSRGRRIMVALDETEHPSLFVDVAVDLQRNDMVQRVKGALDRLTREQREAIELGYFEGLSQSEIAARMGAPLGTVKTWMRRALQLLREEVQGKRQ